MRARGRLGAGCSVPIYTVDMRQQVMLTFAPDGLEFGEPEPVMLSEGVQARALAGVGGEGGEGGGGLML